MEDLNPATTDPLFTVDTLEACGGIIPLSDGKMKVRHPGNAPGSPTWHTGILLLDQCRFLKEKRRG